MGATGWIYFATYEPKPSAALRKLQRQVLASGQYRNPASREQQLQRLSELPKPSQVHRDAADRMRQSAGATPSPEVMRLIAHSERLSEEAAKREPGYLRLLEAIKDGTFATLPEVAAYNALVMQLLGHPPSARSPRGPKADSVTAKISLLRLQAGEAGTHSILDITRTGLHAGHAVASPILPKRLIEALGSPTPTREQVETSGLQLAERLHWRAEYFAVYRDGMPAEWAFVGSTGD